LGTGWSGKLVAVSRSRPLIVGGVVIGALVAALVTWLVVGTAPKRSSATARSIPGSDGIELNAYVITPRGKGKHPLLVMPAAWGAGAGQYLEIGKRLAAHGYEVLSYAQRGFAGSQGQIDLAGTPTQADVSAVITWALKHTPAAAGGVGAVGVSYGAGVSLLAAERDPRIKVVVAMSGWSDLAASYFPNNTGSQEVVNILMASAKTSGTPGPDVQALTQESASGNAAGMAATIGALSPSRSALNGAAALNKNRTAVMLANGFEDSIFPPSQQVALFDRLTGPKRLQLARADHGQAETSGLAGDPSNKLWRDATAWLDRYLRSRHTSIDGQDPVQLQDVKTGTWRHYPKPADVGRASTWYLGAGAAGASAGSLGTKPTIGWQQSIAAGKDSVADAGPPQFDGSKPYELLSGLQVSAVNKTVAGRWDGPAYARATLVNGAPTLHVTVTPSSASTSLFTYLYDVDADGSATLMTFKPYSLAAVTPGTARPVDVALEPISWTVPSGHHLSLVIDTMDPRYLSWSSPGTTVTLSSSAAAPSTLSVPVR
jgi:putative CocE/NonD family hydrolase